MTHGLTNTSQMPAAARPESCEPALHMLGAQPSKACSPVQSRAANHTQQQTGYPYITKLLHRITIIYISYHKIADNGSGTDDDYRDNDTRL
jgi:hypothetical protein